MVLANSQEVVFELIDFVMGNVPVSLLSLPEGRQVCSNEFAGTRSGVLVSRYAL